MRLDRDDALEERREERAEALESLSFEIDLDPVPEEEEGA
jgi:hypothetical protein